MILDVLKRWQFVPDVTRCEFQLGEPGTNQKWRLDGSWMGILNGICCVKTNLREAAMYQLGYGVQLTQDGRVQAITTRKVCTSNILQRFVLFLGMVSSVLKADLSMSGSYCPTLGPTTTVSPTSPYMRTFLRRTTPDWLLIICYLNTCLQELNHWFILFFHSFLLQKTACISWAWKTHGF